jgi:hypothetical protein
MISFNVKLADVLFNVHCRDDIFLDYFKKYIVETDGRGIEILPTDADFKKSKQIYDEMKKARGEREKILSDVQYEKFTLHRLISDELLKRGVLLTHGSAVCVDGEVYLFTARSGVGKSTHTALWMEHFGERAIMINDDKPYLKPSENGVLVYGSPWSGVYHRDTNTSAPLKAIIKLERGEDNILKKISAPEMFMELYKASVKGENPDETKKIAALESQILSAVPSFSLKCDISEDAVKVCYEGIQHYITEEKK